MGNLKLTGLEGAAKGVVVEAQYNPKEISVDKFTPWQLQPGKGPNDLKYAGSEGRTVSFELLFDGFENDASIQGLISNLELFGEVDDTIKRPPKVRVVWGQSSGNDFMPKFDAVIESIGTKYTMFASDGRPLRATVGIKMKEAKNIVVGKT